MKIVLLLDADNTIWDTDSIFTSAQVSMLRCLTQCQFALNPREDLAALRIIDKMLGQQLGTAEYDFNLLAHALIAYSRGLQPEQAAYAALSNRVTRSDMENRACRSAVEALYGELLRPARLLPNALRVLNFVKRKRDSRTHELAAILVTEGRPERILRIIEYHHLNGGGKYFDSIVFGEKGSELFAKARLEGSRILNTTHFTTLVVGDSIQSDIKPGNTITATTIYKPSTFLGEEVPSTPEEQPHYKIEKLSQLLPILESIIGSDQ